jgi:hypothetical protein
MEMLEEDEKAFPSRIGDASYRTNIMRRAW